MSIVGVIQLSDNEYVYPNGMRFALCFTEILHLYAKQYNTKGSCSYRKPEQEPLAYRDMSIKYLSLFANNNGHFVLFCFQENWHKWLSTRHEGCG